MAFPEGQVDKRQTIDTWIEKQMDTDWKQSNLLGVKFILHSAPAISPLFVLLLFVLGVAHLVHIAKHVYEQPFKWKTIQRSRFAFRWMFAGKRWEHGTVHEAHGCGEIGRSWRLLILWWQCRVTCLHVVIHDSWQFWDLTAHATWIYKKWMGIILKMNGM